MSADTFSHTFPRDTQKDVGGWGMCVVERWGRLGPPLERTVTCEIDTVPEALTRSWKHVHQHTYTQQGGTEMSPASSWGTRKSKGDRAEKGGCPCVLWDSGADRRPGKLIRYGGGCLWSPDYPRTQRFGSRTQNSEEPWCCGLLWLFTAQNADGNQQRECSLTGAWRARANSSCPPPVGSCGQ